jgi:WD40 repeat protein/GTPase SAR1 family protein
VPRRRRARATPADRALRAELPDGVRLLRTLRGHAAPVGRIAWSPGGQLLASPSGDSKIRLWNAESGKFLRTIGHGGGVLATAFHPAGQILASGGRDGTIRLSDVHSGRSLRTLKDDMGEVNAVAFDAQGRNLASGSDDRRARVWDTSSGRVRHSLAGHTHVVLSVAFDAEGGMLATGSSDTTVKLWRVSNGRLVHSLEGHAGTVCSVAFHPNGESVASASEDGTIRLWDVASGRLLRTLEGHSVGVRHLAFPSDGRLLASRGLDGSVRLWDSETGQPLAVINEPGSAHWLPGIAFHPSRPLLATAGSGPRAVDHVVHVWSLDLQRLYRPATAGVAYITAKIVLVGDSGVGKTGLGWRLAHGAFKDHASTHGQQFWLLDQLRSTRADGARCEAILWDLAGQPDYRLIHALFLDDAELALVLFDPTRDDEPLHGVEYWLRQLRVGGGERGPLSSTGPPAILVAARTDRGSARLTSEEIEAFCARRGLHGCVPTSALRGDGVDELVGRMRELIRWDDRPTTVTTETFKRIKDHVLALKEEDRPEQVILAPAELRQRLERLDPTWTFTDAEMLTAVGHLANHGYVTRLQTSGGEPRILLAPELLNNLASSLVLEARRNPRGLGSLEEQRLLTGGYRLPELEDLTPAEREVMLDAAAVMFLERSVCFRETDPLSSRAYLVFPELINLRKPVLDDEQPLDEGVAYTVSGAVQNVYASLVVLLGYTSQFTRTNQWRSHARYEVGGGLLCGFRLEAERDGELDLVLYFGATVGAPIRTLFQSLFESFLARRDLTVRRFEPVSCSKGHHVNRAVIREQIAEGNDSIFCTRCGARVTLPRADVPIQLTREQAADVEEQRRAADRRSRFEQALFRLKTYITQEQIRPPECFISYAWGDAKNERWVEHVLATDLLKAGITVLLDRWENARIGASVPRFVERAAKADRVIVVGTPVYPTKYENGELMHGFVLAAEGDLIARRMIGSESDKETVLPVLVAGTEESSFPHLLQGRVYADLRSPDSYFLAVFDLILGLYQIRPQHPVSSELRQLVGA